MKPPGTSGLVDPDRRPLVLTNAAGMIWLSAGHSPRHCATTRDRSPYSPAGLLHWTLRLPAARPSATTFLP